MAEPADNLFCSFGESVQTLKDEWSVQAICDKHVWSRDGENENSDSSPFDVVDQAGIRGKAKPGHLDKKISRAAHEKITSDLAALLDLPVPPVTLAKLDNPPACPHKKTPGDPFICVSAWAYKTCDQWQKHAQKLSEHNVNSAVGPCSAMWAFDCWISAEDRSGTKHILVDSDIKANEDIRIAFIDYAHSLSKKWESIDIDAAPDPWQMPMDVGLRDNQVVESVADNISALDNEIIDEIVTRIPKEWLPTERKKLIISGLNKRKGNIRSITGIE